MGDYDCDDLFTVKRKDGVTFGVFTRSVFLSDNLRKSDSLVDIVSGSLVCENFSQMLLAVELLVGLSTNVDGGALWPETAGESEAIDPLVCVF